MVETLPPDRREKVQTQVICVSCRRPNVPVDPRNDFEAELAESNVCSSTCLDVLYGDCENEDRLTR